MACRVSAENSADNLMGIHLYIICCFSLVAFNIFSLSLIFVSLIDMCLGEFLLGFILHGIICTAALECFLSHVGEAFSCNIFKYFHRPFLFPLSFWYPYNVNVGVINIVPEVSGPNLFSFFFLYSVLWQ